VPEEDHTIAIALVNDLILFRTGTIRQARISCLFLAFESSTFDC
jgi:hypothetical protein